MISISIRTRIMIGFIAIITLLGAINIYSTSKLKTINHASKEIRERTEIVRHVNEFVRDISAQATSLRIFAFSGLDSDKLAVKESQKTAMIGRDNMIEILNSVGATEKASELLTAIDKFKQIFANIENRLGNDQDALQVIVAGIGNLKLSTSNLQKLLTDTGDGDAKKLAYLINSSATNFSQYAVEYTASSNPKKFKDAIESARELDEAVKKSTKMLQSLPRSERAIVRFVRRDGDVIRQSLRQKNAIDIALSEALDQLAKVTQEIARTTEDVKLNAYQGQMAALDGMKNKVAEVTLNNKYGLVVGCIIALLLAGFIGRSISTPLSNITRAVAALAAGDKFLEIPYQNRRDEIGSMAKAAAVFKEKSFELERIAAEKHDAERDAAEKETLRKAEQEAQRVKYTQEQEAEKEERQRLRHQQQLTLADQLESEVAKIVSSIAAMAAQLGRASQEMKNNVNRTNQLSNTAASNSEQTKSNVAQVSHTMLVMEKDLTAVSKQVDKSLLFAKDAMDVAQESQLRMTSLSDSARAITNVIKLIQDIAAQTNLLALNATIEAARAGEAGRGFAVVANEVKSLAAQTAQATEEIESQVSSMTSATQATVDTMSILVKSIRNMNEISQIINLSVEEQTVTSHSIDTCISEASEGVKALQGDIRDVSSMAKSSEDAAENVMKATVILEGQAEYLEQSLGKFLAEIRTQ